MGSHLDALSIFDMENTNSTSETHSSSDSDIEAGAPRELQLNMTTAVPLYFRQNKKFSKAAREKTLQNLRFYAVATAEDVDKVLETTLRNPERKVRYPLSSSHRSTHQTKSSFSFFSEIEERIRLFLGGRVEGGAGQEIEEA